MPNEISKSVRYQLKIKGLPSREGTISVRSLMTVLSKLVDCAERGLRLAVEGESLKRGRLPEWLDRAVDFTVTGMATGSTVLNLEAPILGQTIPEQLIQPDLWFLTPSQEDTAVSLVTRSVRDTTNENLESEYYDTGVLNSLQSFRTFIKTEAEQIELSSEDRPQEGFSLNIQELAKVDRLKERIPEPRVFLVSGHLNSIEHNRMRFQLVVKEGQIIPGRVDEEYLPVEAMREFWGKKVTVKGLVHFKASGGVQVIEAQMIKPMEAGELLFQELPSIQTEMDFARAASRGATERKDWLKEIWGKWPGEESIEKLMEELEHRKS